MTRPADPDDRPDEAYRPCVGIALFDPRGRVFLGRRAGSDRDAPGSEPAWQMPQGGIDPGEAPLAAAYRELREETNVDAGSVVPLGATNGWLAYDLPPAILPARWRGRYRGQAQRWFAFGLTGPETVIDVLAPDGGRHGAEFDAWRWEALARTPELIVSFKRPVYARVAEAFAHHVAWRGTP